MPTLNWIGKDAVVRHHEAVPFHLLQEVPALSCGDDSGHLIVEGDNLLALKALLPHYAGQVKCIYIDPPYNTGNEGWVYNDNVNSAQMKQWLGKVVGKEAEDLSRHDKWLCMMYPRLVMLRNFLRDDGVIIVSIDDFEAHHLRLLMNEVFGANNFIAQLVWDKTRKNDAKLFSVGHEYALIFCKSLRYLRDRKVVWREQKTGAREVIAFWRSSVERHGDNYEAIQDELRAWYKSLEKNHPAKKLSRTRWVDQHGPWRDRDISWPGGGGPRYDVLHPITGEPCKVPEAGWRFANSIEMQRQIDIGIVEFRADHTEPPMRKAHLIPILEESDSSTEEHEDEAGLLVMPSVIHKQAQASVQLLRSVFGGKAVFENPKDHEVIARLIRYVTNSDDIILDSFAGSGTTAHAVLKLNDEDGGSRRYVLVEMDRHIAREVTSERARRVSAGYRNRKGEDVPGLGGGFRYCTLAQPLFDERGQISDSVRFADLAKHVYFVETGAPLPASRSLDSRLRGNDEQKRNGSKGTPLLGVHHGRAVYLLYNGILGDRSTGGGNTLTSPLLAELPAHDGPKVIYGARCLIGLEKLRRLGIVFKQLPYQLKVER